ALQLAVRGLVQAEDVDVHPLPGIGEAGLDLFAYDDLRRQLGPRVEERLAAVDRLVVGDRHEVHPGALGALVDLDRIGVRVPGPQQASGPPGGVSGVDVEVASSERGDLAGTVGVLAHRRDNTL